MLLVVFVLLLVLTRVAVVGRPFIGNLEGLSATVSVAGARNYLRYGVWSSRGAPLINSGRVPEKHWVLYANHPPLHPLAVAASMGTFGESEAACRMVPMLCALAAAVLVYVMMARRCGWPAAMVAAVFFAFCPMVLVYGDTPDYIGSQLLLFGLACVEGYVRFLETARRRWLTLMCGAFGLGALTDWPMFYLVPLLAAHYVWAGSLPRTLAVRRAVPFVLGAVVTFALLAVWTGWATPGFSFVGKLAQRMFGPADHTGPITFEAWVQRVVLAYHGVLHGWLMVALAAVGVASGFARQARTRLSIGPGVFAVPGLVLAWGVAHSVIGTQGNYEHDYWNIVVTPGLAMAAGWGAACIGRRLPQRLLQYRTGTAVAVGLAGLLYVGCSALTAYDYARAEFTPDRGYSLKEVGGVIREVSAEDDGVITSYAEGLVNPWLHSAVFFYADRQLRPAILNIADFEHALGPGPYALQGGWYTQPGGPAPKWFVLPPPHRAQLAELTAYLDAHYPRTMVRGYSVYRLEW